MKRAFLVLFSHNCAQKYVLTGGAPKGALGVETPKMCIQNASYLVKHSDLGAKNLNKDCQKIVQ